MSGCIRKIQDSSILTTCITAFCHICVTSRSNHVNDILMYMLRYLFPQLDVRKPVKLSTPLSRLAAVRLVNFFHNSPK